MQAKCSRISQHTSRGAVIHSDKISENKCKCLVTFSRKMCSARCVQTACQKSRDEFFLKRKGSITSGDSCYNVKDEGHVTEKDIQAGTTANRLPNWLCLHSYCINHISLVSEVPEKQPKDVSVRNVTLALHFVAVAPEYYHVC